MLQDIALAIHQKTISHRLLWCSFLLYIAPTLYIVPNVAFGDIYKTTNELGYPVYSDQPTENNKPVKLDKIQTIQTKSPKLTITTIGKQTVEEKENAHYYKQLTIGFPLPDTILENRPATVTFVVNISPNLMRQHYVQLTKNGQVIAGPQSAMSLTVSGLERGEHHIVPQIIDEAGKLILSGKGITIHVKQPSALHQNKAKPTHSAPK